jgi:hypothetical protein
VCTAAGSSLDVDLGCWTSSSSSLKREREREKRKELRAREWSDHKKNCNYFSGESKRNKNFLNWEVGVHMKYLGGALLLREKSNTLRNIVILMESILIACRTK